MEFNREKNYCVHGISLDKVNCQKFAALVWCPDSNLFLYNKTSNIEEVKNGTEILFGSDSTVSSDWNFWKHIRFARNLGYLSNNELYESLSVKSCRNLGAT